MPQERKRPPASQSHRGGPWKLHRHDYVALVSESSTRNSSAGWLVLKRHLVAGFEAQDDRVPERRAGSVLHHRRVGGHRVVPFARRHEQAGHELAQRIADADALEVRQAYRAVLAPAGDPGVGHVDRRREGCRLAPDERHEAAGDAVQAGV